MADQRVVVLRSTLEGLLHDVVRAGDTLVDQDGNQIFVLGITPKLSLPEYDNLTPQDGDIWKWGGVLWTHLGGSTYQLELQAPSSSSSLYSVSCSSISSSYCYSSSSIWSSSSLISSSSSESSLSSISSSSNLSSMATSSSSLSSSSSSSSG